MTRKKLVIGGVIVAAVALLAFAAQQTLKVPLRLDAVPFELTARAVVPGIPNARYFVLSDVESLVRDALAARQREEAFLSQSGRAGELPPLELLAISGGGDKGAFGAGLLNGNSILLASAAIPGAFPPTLVDVEVDGKRYQEMHVDGGASAQVFLYPPSMANIAARMGEGMVRSGRVYVLRNASLAPTWSPVERRTISIAARAIDSLITTQGFGDLYRIYATTRQDKLDFNLAYIGDDFVYENKKEQFETAYMKALYDYGYRLGRAGYQWQKTPPGLLGAAFDPVSEVTRSQ